jgi:hypothetical protein
MRRVAALAEFLALFRLSLWAESIIEELETTKQVQQQCDRNGNGFFIFEIA